MVFRTTSQLLQPLPRDLPDDVPIFEFLLNERYGRHPLADSRPAYTCGITGLSYSAHDISERIEYVARSLAQIMGWEPNSGSECDKVVGIFSQNAVDAIPSMWATHRLSGIVTPINASYVKAEVIHQLSQAHVKALFTCRSLLPIALEAARAVGIATDHIFLLDTGADLSRDPGLVPFKSFDELVRLGKEAPSLEPLKWSIGQGETQPAFICFSSGTSGLPKGVLISHRNVIANVLQLAGLERTQREPGKTETALGLLPQSHIYALVVICHGCVYRGDQVVILPKYELSTMLRAVTKYAIATLFLHAEKLEEYDLGHVRNLLTGAAAFSPTAWATLERIFPNGVLRQGYGLTESSASVSSSPRSDCMYGSSGVLLSGIECKIVTESGEERTGYGEEGELWIRSPSIAMGYLNNDRATRETFVRDGWLRTGDKALFRRGPNGSDHLFIVDRIKELIKVKGMQVAPAELEAYILANEAVADVAVIGVQDERHGEVPKAFIVKRLGSNITDEQLTEEIHQSFKKDKARYKHLRGGIEIQAAIPKSPSGKILRRQLKDQESKLWIEAAYKVKL
ncbi:acetyl synthetase [Fusarium tjaetaba]|uniref:Acetyl synthetase n=1 Tax=Fusarium tjaetaba TaxID=1567544 RepID=A0A8H5S532_9HYPO|nr:acetyl synthetase [Fusarium tjaetaba]KAF5646074.1 acetyl synthetase [Fusarium tjaetaba]